MSSRPSHVSVTKKKSSLWDVMNSWQITVFWTRDLMFNRPIRIVEGVCWEMGWGVDDSEIRLLGFNCLVGLFVVRLEILVGIYRESEMST